MRGYNFNPLGTLFFLTRTRNPRDKHTARRRQREGTPSLEGHSLAARVATREGCRLGLSAHIDPTPLPAWFLRKQELLRRALSLSVTWPTPTPSPYPPYPSWSLTCMAVVLVDRRKVVCSCLPLACWSWEGGNDEVGGNTTSGGRRLEQKKTDDPKEPGEPAERCSNLQCQRNSGTTVSIGCSAFR